MPEEGDPVLSDSIAPMAKHPERWLMESGKGKNGNMTDLAAIKHLVQRTVDFHGGRI